MKRYYVSVTEILNKIVSVDAESEEEAVNAVQDTYNNCDIVLDSDNFTGEVVQVEPDQEFYVDYEKDYGETTERLIGTSTSQTGRVISLPITKTLRL